MYDCVMNQPVRPCTSCGDHVEMWCVHVEQRHAVNHHRYWHLNCWLHNTQRSTTEGGPYAGNP